MILKIDFEATNNAYIFAIRLGELAQLVERPESIREGHTIRGISSVGRALAWHARGHRFESGILHQKLSYNCDSFFCL